MPPPKLSFKSDGEYVYFKAAEIKVVMSTKPAVEKKCEGALYTEKEDSLNHKNTMRKIS